MSHCNGIIGARQSVLINTNTTQNSWFKSLQTLVTLLYRSLFKTVPLVLHAVYYCSVLRTMYKRHSNVYGSLHSHVVQIRLSCEYMCVHLYVLQRTAPKAFQQQMENLQKKIEAKRDALADLEKELKVAKKEAKGGDSKAEK